MVKQIEMLGVYDEGLELIERMTPHEKDRVSNFLSLIKVNLSSNCGTLVPIPDEAPEKLKNEAALNRGKFYRAVSKCSDCVEQIQPVAFEWYVANDRKVLYVWQMFYVQLVK